MTHSIASVVNRYCVYTGVMLSPESRRGLEARVRELDARHEYDVLDPREFRRAGHPGEVLDLLDATDVGVWAIVVDKAQMSVAYAPGMNPSPDDIGLRYLMRQFAGWMREHGMTGDVMADCRGRREDRSMKRAYERAYAGQGRRPVVDAGEVYRSRQMKFASRTEQRPAGIRLARFIAHPTMHYIYRSYKWAPSRPVSDDAERRAVRILTHGKFLREYNG